MPYFRSLADLVHYAAVMEMDGEDFIANEAIEEAERRENEMWQLISAGGFGPSNERNDDE